MQKLESEWVSERANECNGARKRSSSADERCERMSEWPITLRVNIIVFQPSIGLIRATHAFIPTPQRTFPNPRDWAKRQINSSNRDIVLAIHEECTSLEAIKVKSFKKKSCLDGSKTRNYQPKWYVAIRKIWFTICCGENIKSSYLSFFHRDR